MKRVIFLLVAAIFLSTTIAISKTDNNTQQLVDTLKAEIKAHARLSEKSRDLAILKMLPMVKNPVFVQETLKQNKKGVSLSEIKKIDKQWINAEEELPVQSEKLNNTVAKAIKSWVRKNPEFVEVLVMDD